MPFPRARSPGVEAWHVPNVAGRVAPASRHHAAPGRITPRRQRRGGAMISDTQIRALQRMKLNL